MNIEQSLILDERFEGWAIAGGLTSDGREVVVMRRMYNTIITIGPPGAGYVDEHW